MGKSLLQQISELKEQKVDYDIEDNDLKQVFSDQEDVSDDEIKNDHYVQVDKSKLRQKNDSINLGSKYKGSVKSRDELYGDDDEEEEDEEEEDDDDENEIDDEDEDEEIDEEEDDNSGVDLDDADSSDESASDEESDSQANTELDHQRSKLKQLITSERKHIVSRLSQSATNDSLKGYAIQQQHKFFDKLIDSRLKLQKALINSNQLPVEHVEVSSEKIEEAKTACYDLMDSIFKLRNELLVQDNISKDAVKLPKKRSFDSYSSTTTQFDEKLAKYRHEILVKWSGKVQNSSGSNALNQGKFKAINQSFDQQVENNLHDMERFVKRTRLNRRQITPIGYKVPQPEQVDEDADIPQEKPVSTITEIAEIYDDDDFYRVLLNDLVDKKIQSSNPTTGLTMLKSAQKVQKLHKNVDSKASKGRKLKYTVQEPIANLEVPRNNWKWDDNQIDEFFASLLGQKVNMNEQEEVEEDEVTVGQDSIKLFG